LKALSLQIESRAWKLTGGEWAQSSLGNLLFEIEMKKKSAAIEMLSRGFTINPLT
jgi:hypothetical protein